MEYKDFIRAVAERAALSRQEAEDLARATVEMLGDRLSAGEAKRLATSLPEPLRGSLHVRDRIEDFGLSDFVTRVSERTGLTEKEATAGVRAVLVTVREMVDDEVFDHVLAQLPGEFQEMVETTT
ncbi:DUF2267 domain-containing protein [Streptosporangium sp. CA-115845]|uniref:DUF2267 domain-containing protein n=1 Tax=Streptosporangium sp. CA-115845 TaxID=3240071 RepID=UPI003D933C03